MNMSRCLMLVGFCLLGAGIAQGQELLDPQQPYQAEKREPVEFEFDYSVVVTAPYHTKTLKVWLPIPQSDSAQEVSGSQLSTFPMDVEPRIGTEPRFGNKFAYFEFDHPEGAQVIRHRFQAKTWELVWNIDPARIQKVEFWPKTFDVYRRAESQAVVADERFENLLGQIVPNKTGGFEDFGKVLGFVNESFKYDHSKASLKASAVHALENQGGHCSDYHGFCASMGRLLGTPTRVTYGINTFAKASPSHCKLEAFLPPYGWVSFDVSETQKLAQSLAKNEQLSAGERMRFIDAAQRRLMSGYRDNTWLLQTRGTDYDLVPPASQRVPVVRTIYAEADGVPLPDPDPSDINQNTFSWMTVLKITPSRQVSYPFKDPVHLKDWVTTSKAAPAGE